MYRRDGKSYQTPEEHYRERMSIYEDREKKILKQPEPVKRNRQRRTNLIFVLPIIIIAVICFPKIAQYYETNVEKVNSESSGTKPPKVRDVIDYLQKSKATEVTTSSLLKIYVSGGTADFDAVQNEITKVQAAIEMLNSGVPKGFEEYNEYQQYVLATDVELLKVLIMERNSDAINYFNTMAQRRNSLARHRKNAMKAALDELGVKYTEKENGDLDIEYF